MKRLTERPRMRMCPLSVVGVHHRQHHVCNCDRGTSEVRRPLGFVGEPVELRSGGPIGLTLVVTLSVLAQPVVVGVDVTYPRSNSTSASDRSVAPTVAAVRSGISPADSSSRSGSSSVVTNVETDPSDSKTALSNSNEQFDRTARSTRGWLRSPRRKRSRPRYRPR